MIFNFLSWLFLFWVISKIYRAWSTPSPADRARSRNQMLEGLSGMLAKMAKADGHVTKEEVELAQQLLHALRLTEGEYQFCVGVFNRAVKDGHSISDYARLFRSQTSGEARQLVYEFLWSIAGADGRLDPREDELLRRVVVDLGFPLGVYAYYYRLHIGGTHGSSYSSSSNSGYASNSTSDLERAYAKLGCKSSDSDSTLRAAYRKQAMRYHPDRLRAEGLPEGLLEKANQSMAEINAAWDVIKKARGIN